MRAWARFRRDDDEVFEVPPGGLVGRLSRADVPVLDARVSEAHALVSLRGDELRLIGLRGRFRVDGEVVGEAPLVAGALVELAPGVRLRVEEVVLPDAVLGLREADTAPTPLHGVTALGGPAGLRTGYHRDAEAHVVTDGEAWYLDGGADGRRRLVVGEVLRVGSRTWEVVEVPLARAAAAPTRGAGGFDAPITLVARYDTVHLQRDGAPSAALSGMSARLVSELVAAGAPLSWQGLSAELWPGEEPNARVRRRLDMALSRLRRRLAELGVRDDLVRTDGCGHVELVLGAHDEVVDET